MKKNERIQKTDKHGPKGMKHLCLGNANGLCRTGLSLTMHSIPTTFNICINNSFRFINFLNIILYSFSCKSDS